MPGKIRFVVAGLLLMLLATLWLLRPSAVDRQAVQGPKLFQLLLSDFEQELEVPADLRVPVRLVLTAQLPGSPTQIPEENANKLRKKFRELLARQQTKLRPAGAGPSRLLRLYWANALELRLETEDLQLDSQQARPSRIPARTYSRQVAGYASLLPPFLTILIAVLLGQTIPALLAGILLGAFLLKGFTGGLGLFTRTYLYEKVLISDFRLEILGFVIFLVITVGIMTRAGGIEGLVELIRKVAKTARSCQLATWAMGLVIFFDDYANAIVVGSTMRPLTDRMRVSREKLAYIVDSTAAPIAGISVLSTWVAYEISTFSSQLPEVGLSENQGFEIFLATLPYRFYCVFTLFLVLATILLRRDFGPMLAAERRARRSGEVLRKGASPMVSHEMTMATAKDGVPARWYNAVLPIATLICVTLYTLWHSGAAGRSFAFDMELIRSVLNDAKSAQAILYGAMSSAALAAILALLQHLLGPAEILSAAWLAIRGLFFAVVILVLAWCIGYVCSDLGTAYYLVAQTQGSLPPLLLPVLLFLLSCLVAFATGSSWSTMAILLPIVVILSNNLGSSLPIGGQMLMVLSIGAVLEGSIFGDHCSPISDTTVLSSVASASDHLDHVQTQIPYALLAMLVSIVFGYLPAAFISPSLWPLSLGLGMATIVGFLYWKGGDPERSAS